MREYLVDSKGGAGATGNRSGASPRRRRTLYSQLCSRSRSRNCLALVLLTIFPPVDEFRLRFWEGFGLLEERIVEDVGVGVGVGGTGVLQPGRSLRIPSVPADDFRSKILIMQLDSNRF